MLKQTPPPELAAFLTTQGVQTDDLLIFTDTDIDALGQYEVQWLAITGERLLTFTDAPAPRLLLNLELKNPTEYRCQSTIGSGLLQARIDGLYVDVLRYSNRLADRFGKIARKLDRFLQGEPIVLYPEDDIDPLRCPKCQLMLSGPGDVCPRCVDKGAVLSRMWGLMRPYRGQAILIMSLLFFGILLDLVGPKLTQHLVDNVLPGSKQAAVAIQGDAAVRHVRIRLLCEVVGILALVQVLRMGVNIANGKLGAKVGTAVTFDMRRRLVEHLQQLSVAYYDRQQVGSLVGRVAYDTEALHGFVMQLTGGFLFQIIMVIGVGIMIFSINAKLAFFTMIPAPLVITGSFVFWRYIYPRYYRFWDASSKQAGMLSGTLSGIRVVKAFSQEGREVERFNNASDRLRGTRLNVDGSTAIFNPIMGLVFQLGGWIVWFIGGNDVLKGQMTLGSLMAFFGYLWMFYGPLGSLTQFTNWLTQFVTQAHRIFEILDTPPEAGETGEPIPLPLMEGDITFERVSFGYNRHTPILQDLNLKITAGEMIGIVGRSGSGKTTVVNLLSRFYDVDEGRVLIDGLDVRRIAREDLRRQVGVVLQEPFLFRGSIMQNIVYGMPEATPEQVIASTKAANAHDFIMRSAHGYDTWVGERGAGLSGGERQRVSIARVLLTNPRILILDEATSSVDTESEAAIQAALAEVIKGRTTIAIAHRLSTLRNADRILVVDRGKIVEQGSHSELMNLDGGLYAKLLKIQGQMAPASIDKLAAQAEQEEEEKKESEKHKLAEEMDRQNRFPELGSHHPRWLMPDVAHIHLGNLGALHVTIADEMAYGGIYAVRCMPVAYPGEFISLRFLNEEKREVEVGLIRRMSDWPQAAQALVENALKKRYFVHLIEAIEAIQVFNGYLNFKVETDLGPREFMMRWQGDRAHDFGTGGKMLVDTDENRYLIPELNALPEKQRALFTRYIYW